MTLKAGVVGWPISQSKSPRIHGHWIQEFGLDATYEAIAIAPDQFERGIRDLVDQGYKGVNVTIPHKEAAFDLSDHLTERAKSIGAVNTLVFKNSKIHGDNTDGIGFLNNILSAFPDWDASNGPAVVLGAGGAARAVIWAMIEAGCTEVRLWNRTSERARNLADVFGQKVTAWDDTPESACCGAGFLVNTTSLGMTGQPALELDISGLQADALVTDIVYAPLQTDLLKTAAKRGHRVVDGLGMLLHQAVPGFEAWFEHKPEVTNELRDIVLK